MSEEKIPSWIEYIRRRIKNNKNFLCMIVGPTGSSKSFSGLSILEMLNENFNIDMTIFRGKDLMTLINSGEYEYKKNDGENTIGFLWDEAGVDLSNRSWQSTTNKVLNFLLQTFRHKNFVLIFTAPYMDFVDSSTRKLFHAVFETCGINKQNQTSTLKPKQLQYNADRKKFYYHYLKVLKKGVGMVKIKRWKIPRPSKNLEKEYEKKKIYFTSKLNKEIEQTLNNLDVDGKKRGILTERQQFILSCWEKGVKIQVKIAESLSNKENKIISPQLISQNEQFMRRKGYYKENH